MTVADTWAVVRNATGWSLCVGRADSPTGSVAMNEDTAWRMYTHVLGRAEVEARSTITGDLRLTHAILEAFALVS